MPSHAAIANSDAVEALIPKDWLADPGRTTPAGDPATYRSSIHALMALRLRYRCDVMHETQAELAAARDRYQTSWERFNQNGFDMQEIVRLVGEGDVDGAAALWNTLDQHAVDGAYRCVIGEREQVPEGGVNLMTHVWREYDLEPAVVADELRDRELRDSDSEEAWQRSVHGRCNGCGTPTISTEQRRRLHVLMESASSAFDLTPVYRQHSGAEATLWKSITIAAKGVADHIVPWSLGGRTDPSNLTNACSGCNYSRQHATLDSMGVQAYDRPAVELTWQESGRLSSA